MTDIDIRNYGPLRYLIGIWEGEIGHDIALDDDLGIETNKFRERMFFEPMGQIDNHAQKLFGLRYKTMAWRLGEPDTFHEELGYWLWDAKAKQVMRCFMIPRGVTVIAGGRAKEDDRVLKMSAKLGSKTYGICSNIFLDKEFRTVEYKLKMSIVDENSIRYEEDSVLKLKGRSKLFHHRDANTLRRVAR